MRRFENSGSAESPIRFVTYSVRRSRCALGDSPLESDPWVIQRRIGRPGTNLSTSGVRPGNIVKAQARVLSGGRLPEADAIRDQRRRTRSVEMSTCSKGARVASFA